MLLHEELEKRVNEWRKSGYKTDKCPAIAEVLLYQHSQETSYLRYPRHLRYLREAQLEALETYWYLRLVANTPGILDLYKQFFDNPIDLLEAFGIQTSNKDLLKEIVAGNRFYERVKNDDKFAQQNHLEALRESLTLDYPNYILALAMGAGKTILIGTIIATEFALAIEYPEGNSMKNALVFAPGTTIIESLKEISDIPFDKIIPSRLYKPFIANLKLTYTRSGESDIPVEAGGLFNLVVTNTEKIALRKVKKSKTQTELEFNEKKHQEELFANLRLQKISSLPNLGIFSDEAHHTHGQTLGEELKRVRSTINYLHGKKDLVCVVNTTGTPYFKRQTLKDVVFWYGLSEGIKDNILKSLENGIISYDMEEEEQQEDVITDIIKRFFDKYGKTKLINGAKSKIAFYFPTEESLKETRPLIEQALIKAGQKPVTLKNTQKSTKEEIDAFNSLNEPNAMHRVILLVGKGTEGWNCPSLFATALIRKVKSSNNFVLQAGTRCLRQVAGNDLPATIYLDTANYNTLDKELRETYGSKLSELTDLKTETATARIIILKTKIPAFVIKKIIKKVVPVESGTTQITLKTPKTKAKDKIAITTYSPIITGGERILFSTSGTPELIEAEKIIDLYTASHRIAENYYLDQMNILSLLRAIYTDEIPLAHLADLFRQVEAQTVNYKITEEIIEEALALIRLKNREGNDNFTKDDGQYYTEIRYTKAKKHLLLNKEERESSNKHDFGFHYSPYNFDSNPEKDFFDQLLVLINENPEDVQDIYFTGALTNPEQTDFYFEYKGKDGKYHNYFPDFVVRLKSGKYYIVEIKAENERIDPIDGENGAKKMVLKELEKLNEDRFKYEIVFTATDRIQANKLTGINNFVRGK